ncbi:predicted protein [Plenodomus lingam JN3]|uniref:Predicted protein n=1 Tax=Leptosphaeria maculans (strain JN3 / isolate v23.1.3 / race Av1-4-5-6-7-8) TaxID=985895 RepID=E5ACV2_LEPMJ|nr:predicted protein [Plenodomus lingam JN3]CBY02304.1 predicted protein [Plenodomus lingam JN3]
MDLDNRCPFQPLGRQSPSSMDVSMETFAFFFARPQGSRLAKPPGCSFSLSKCRLVAELRRSEPLNPKPPPVTERLSRGGNVSSSSLNYRDYSTVMLRVFRL